MYDKEEEEEPGTAGIPLSADPFFFCVPLLDLWGSPFWDRFVGLVGKASALRVEDPGFKSCLPRDFLGSSHTSELKIGTPVATLPGAWHYWVSAETGQPGVSIL